MIGIGAAHFHQRPRICPYCGHQSPFAVGSLGTLPPAPGCVSVCAQCHSVSVYGPDLVLVRVDERTLPDDRRLSVRRLRAWLRGLEGGPVKTVRPPITDRRQP